MKTWLLGLWLDEAKFRALMRALVFALGDAVRAGVVPTGVDHGGAYIGHFLMFAALLVNAGQQNSQPVTPTERDAALAKLTDTKGG